MTANQVTPELIQALIDDVARPRRHFMVVLPPGIYDTALSNGASLAGFVRQEEMPVTRSGLTYWMNRNGL